MLGKGPCDFISCQLRFRNLFGEKGGQSHANEAKPSQQKETALACKSNEAQPVTIGDRLGFESVYKTRAIAQLAISSAVCTRIPRLSRSFEPEWPTATPCADCAYVRSQAAASANRTCTPSTPRQARVAPMLLASVQSQARPAFPAPARAGCLPACLSCAQAPRRPLPRGWSPRCRNASQRTTCPPR